MKKGDKYKRRTLGYVVTVIDPIGAGMCDKTIGMTVVIYQRPNEDFYCIMEYREFQKEFEEQK